MKKTTLAAAILLAASGSAQANHLWDMTGGAFDFYDGSGVLSPQVENGGFSHKNVDGSFNLGNQTGAFSTTTLFNGALWSTDINQMMFAANDGTTSNQSYTWTTETWFINNAAVTCRISGSIDNCVDENASGGAFLGTATDSYAFTLSDGQFAAGVFFDWNGNDDIPVLAAMQVTAQGFDENGNLFMDIVSIDTDGDGVPGTAMATAPFPDNTPAFSGRLICRAATDCDTPPVTPTIPVPAAVWLFGSGLLGLAGVARRRKAS